MLTDGGMRRATSWMPMDLHRVDDHYVVNVDLPGVGPGSIDLDVDAIQASYDQGVLSLAIPIAERSKPRKIAIEHSGSAAITGEERGASCEKEAGSR